MIVIDDFIWLPQFVGKLMSKVSAQVEMMSMSLIVVY